MTLFCILPLQSQPCLFEDQNFWIQGFHTHAQSVVIYFFEQGPKNFGIRQESGSLSVNVPDTNMAAVSLSMDTNLAVVTSLESQEK